MRKISGGVATLTLAGAALFSCAAAPATNSASASAPRTLAPTTPREFYNLGTQLLSGGKLREAEAALETALSSQNEQVQPPALYNLGHIRFLQGVEELKKGPPASAASARAQAAARVAADAVKGADEALASNDLNQMIAAYMRGRGVRKDLKAAVAAVRRAMEVYGGALQRWERSAGDFRGAHELKPRDEEARQNAEILDRSIAKLVDSIMELQQMAGQGGEQLEKLKQKMKELKGRIPEEDMPSGSGGDDEEDEEQPKGPREGQTEPSGSEGQEMTVSPEQAAWLLEGYKLDKERRLPMGRGDQGEPKDRKRRPW